MAATTGKQKSSGNLIVLSLVLCLAIFIVDVMLPRGYAVSLVYIAVSALFLWIRSRKLLITFAILTSILTIAGYFLSPEGGEAEIAIFNRALSLAGIWLAAYVISRFTEAEQKRLKNESQLTALYNAATEAILISGTDGIIVMANPRAHSLFGYAQGELPGHSIEDLIPARYRKMHEKHRVHFNMDPHSRAMGMGMDLYASRRDGSEFPVEISLGHFRQGDKLFVISFIIDITRRKEADTQLRSAKAALERYTEALKQSNSELEQFAYVASHDLQEPLRKIQAFGDRLKTKESEKLAPESKDYLERMLNAAGRMKGLINDLLSFSRVSTQAKPFVHLDLNQVMAGVLSDLEVAIETSGAQVNIETLPELDADPLQMRQLFQNLLSNAIKFRKEGVPPVISVTTEKVGDEFVRIFVRDNGIGFDQKYAEKIFTIFQRLEGRKYEGTGVGLAICRKIVQRHGGEITAESTPGEGAVFSFTLPLRQVQHNNKVEETSPPTPLL